jgi:hypothetical protein
MESMQQVEGTCAGLAVQVEERIASRGVVLQTRLEEAGMELLSDVMCSEWSAEQAAMSAA